MTNKIVAIQGNNPSKLNPVTDTSVFLHMKYKTKTIKYFIMTLKIYLSLIPKLLLQVFLLNSIIKIKNFLKF